MSKNKQASSKSHIVSRLVKASGRATQAPISEELADSTDAYGESTSKPRGEESSQAVWCDISVALMFKLRYKSPLSLRFQTRNNNDKGLAYGLLASELSVDMRRVFTQRQVKDKLAKMKSEWSKSNPSTPLPTGNDSARFVPAHYDVMLEYWGDKDGYRRESLMTTDDGFEAEEKDEPNRFNEMAAGFDAQSDGHHEDEHEFDSWNNAKHAQRDARNKKRVFSRTKDETKSSKQKTHADAIEAGLFAIKDGLVSLGQAMSSSGSERATNTATMDDVLIAIRAQTEAMQAQAQAFQQFMNAFGKQQ
ncbi:hypothetical protein AC1031_020407 [Aphanomyces cochlioides]|nr:hypothetical protein AC1031_002533 [Aphanomyces cochlioides]KAG9408549.1 hypothetical protein AC1031_020407 [Aphanomyces cochlioides]